jgi:hypothetical protein
MYYIYMYGMDRINVVQDMDKWWTVVKKAVNIRVPHNGSRFLTSRGINIFSRMVLFHRLGYVVSRLLICVRRLSSRPSCHCCHGLHFLVQSITASAGGQLTTKRETSRALPCGSQMSSKNPAYETTKGHVLIILLFQETIYGVWHIPVLRPKTTISNAYAGLVFERN